MNTLVAGCGPSRLYMMASVHTRQVHAKLQKSPLTAQVAPSGALYKLILYYGRHIRHALDATAPKQPV